MNAIIDIKNFGVIKVELNEKEAPITVDNFVKLANKGFYDGLIFHRVIEGFMLQGGDPTGTGTSGPGYTIQGGCPIGNGTGGPGYCIKGEFKANGVNNTISHKRGVISMARAMDFDSAGSQFFIMHKDGEFLDGQYAAFGQVVSGIEVVDAVARVRTTPSDRPYEPVVINKITIE